MGGSLSLSGEAGLTESRKGTRYEKDAVYIQSECGNGSLETETFGCLRYFYEKRV